MCHRRYNRRAPLGLRVQTASTSGHGEYLTSRDCSSGLRMRLLLLLRLLFLLHVFNGSWHPSCCITAILWSSISLINHYNILFARPVEVRNLKTSFFQPELSIQLKMPISSTISIFFNPAIIRFLSSLYYLHIKS